MNIGRRYTASMTTVITRQLLADEVVFFLTPSGKAITRVLSMWWSPVGVDDKNETNAMEIVRVNSVGEGGSLAAIELFELGSPINDAAVSAHGIDDDGWVTNPPVLEVLGGARPFNVAEGWFWPNHNRQTMQIHEISGLHEIGFRIVRTLSSAMSFTMGMTFLEIGG